MMNEITPMNMNPNVRLRFYPPSIPIENIISKIILPALDKIMFLAPPNVEGL